MNICAIDRTIRAMCKEVEAMKPQHALWDSRTEKDLLYEAVVCIYSSQMIFEVAVAAADHLKAEGLLYRKKIIEVKSEYEHLVREALSSPLEVTIHGRQCQTMVRFRNRLPALLAETARNIYGSGTTLKKIIRAAASPQQARELLIAAVAGFGPKQASLYMRRIGYSDDFAVLDTHVLDYLSLSQGFEIKPGLLSRLASYERIEADFKRIAGQFGYATGCVDLATWVTMRAAKLEYAL